MTNRIAEWRERKGLTQAQLAERVRTTQPTIGRLERGAQELTEEWMVRISTALEISPVDLLGIAIVAELRNEIEAQPVTLDSHLAAALMQKGISTFRVISSAVPNLGVKLGTVIPIDTSDQAKQNIISGSVVAARVSSRRDGTLHGLVLRQFVAPALLTTNRPGRNSTFSLDDEELNVEILGVMLPNA